MKHTQKLLLIAIALFFSTAAYSQYSHLGVRAGLNLSNMTVEGNNDSNLKYGFHIGLFDKMMVNESFAVQPELLYTSKGFKNNFDESLIADGQANFNLNYIEVPVKLVYNLSEDFEFQFGPYFSYLVNANVDTDAEVLNFFNIDTNDDINRDYFNAFDFGLTAGLGFTLDPVVLGFNYNLGLTKVAKDDEPTQEMLGDARNTVIQIYAGFIF